MLDLFFVYGTFMTHLEYLLTKFMQDFKEGSVDRLGAVNEYELKCLLNTLDKVSVIESF